MSVSEMLCRRVLLAVCMLCLHEYEDMFAGHCDALRCVRYAFVAAPALHATRQNHPGGIKPKIKNELALRQNAL